MKFLIDNYLYILLMFVSGGMLLWPTIQRRTQGATVNPNGAIALMNQDNAQLIDVRTPEAFAQGRITQAKNIPAAEIAARAAELAKHACIVVQGDGTKSAVDAAVALRAAGAPRVVILEGGYAAWIAAGLPVVKK